jgi:hypothetical protein
MNCAFERQPSDESVAPKQYRRFSGPFTGHPALRGVGPPFTAGECDPTIILGGLFTGLLAVRLEASRHLTMAQAEHREPR